MNASETTIEKNIVARSRGIGNDVTVGCIACDLPKMHNGEHPLVNNISFFVETKSDGENLVGLFGGRGARLDYRDFEPHRIQAKVGACDYHLPVLEALELAVRANDNLINAGIVRSVLSSTGDLEFAVPTSIDQRRIEMVRDFLMQKLEDERASVKARAATLSDRSFATYRAYMEARLSAVETFLRDTKYARELSIFIYGPTNPPD